MRGTSSHRLGGNGTVMRIMVWVRILSNFPVLYRLSLFIKGN